MQAESAVYKCVFFRLCMEKIPMDVETKRKDNKGVKVSVDPGDKYCETGETYRSGGD